MAADSLTNLRSSPRCKLSLSAEYFSFESLMLYWQDTLEIKCDVKDKKGCSEKEVKFIDTMNAKTSDDRAKELTRLSNMKVTFGRQYHWYIPSSLTHVNFAGRFNEARAQAVACSASQCFEAAPSLSDLL